MSEQVGKKAILFDVDDTLYDQTVPFMEAYAEYFGEKPEVPAEVIYPVTRKYSDAVYSQAMAGEMTMEEMYIYRMQKAFEEFGIRITDQEALDFQKIYADRQHHIHMSPLMQDILAFCSGRAALGIITNGPSEHQWDKVRSLQAEKWIPGEAGQEDLRLCEADDETGGCGDLVCRGCVCAGCRRRGECGMERGVDEPEREKNPGRCGEARAGE